MTLQQLSPRLYSWASVIEQEALAQAHRTASMQFIFPHLALMPDAHWGMGATVGSVIPTEGAIIPAAVGVDIGCVDGDSEYLSPVGWRKISQYDGGPVMQYEPVIDGTGIGHFVQPEAYIVKPCEKFFRFRTKYGIDQMLTADHRVLCWRLKGRDRREALVTMTADAFAAEHESLKQGFKARFATTFVPDLDTEIALTAEQIRVQVMVNADGHLDHGGKVAIRLKKERKITRARDLLTRAEILWTERTSATDNVTTFRFTPPLYTRSYAPFWEAHHGQLMHLTDECLYWDGSEAEQCFYTRDRESADFIQYAFTACGRRAVLRADTHPDGKLDYRVFRHDKTMVSMAGVPKTPITVVPAENGKAYCFTVPSGFWVMRRGGNIVMTGNCGMMAVRTQWTEAEVRDRAGSLAPLREAIERAIPSSAGKYNSRLARSSARARVTELEDMKGISSAAEISPQWHLQLGSLGGGNHFIEISADERGSIWAFLHSGSRGVGNKLAMKHIRIAQMLARKWKIPLPDKDLAYLIEEDHTFWSYIEDLRWAQHFALLNRAEMMDRTLECLEEFMGTQARRGEMIACHHNYTEQEDHYGQKVWLSRKGAIDAHFGVPGLIPGSMGALSYVVTGKGSREALHSAPHGAGRLLSRSAARRTFTVSQLEESMQGIEWNRDSGIDFLDESPGAYKPIERVMADAADLVEIQHELRQILNVKGE
jgi:tRNA-splicing ligase RtcB (3'-phosphate/5'-hydroxy nucleic acid ligase)